MNGRDLLTRSLKDEPTPVRQVGHVGCESLTEVMRRVTEEAKKEIERAVREVDDRAA
jgi:hypothetical protein